MIVRPGPDDSDPGAPQEPASVTPLPGRSEADAALVRQIAHARDKTALDLLARHYGPRLKAWLIYRGEQDHTAEDIVQDVMVTVWMKASLFDAERGSFSTWAYRLARNRWIDQKRRNSRVEPTEMSEIARLADSAVSPADSDYEQREMSRAVHQELALLTPEQKHMLHLAFFEGLSHSEIASRTGLPLGTVKSRIRAPLKKMQAGLKQFSEFASDE